MKFISLKLKDGFSQSEYLWRDVTVVLSAKNRAGKTTLIRSLLYALGYPIPATKEVRFNKISFELSVQTDGGELVVLQRHCDEMLVRTTGGEELCVLPGMLHDIHRKVFGIESVLVLKNLLGAFYLDQEKGWTLLNRGTVIGGIHFSIEDLVRGLSNRPCTEECVALRRVAQEIQKYQQIHNFVNYKAAVTEHGTVYPAETKDDEIRKEISRLQNLKLSAQNELQRVVGVIKKNTAFENYVAAMCLRVVDADGREIFVTKNNIVGYADTKEYLNAKRDGLKFQIENIDGRIEDLLAELPDSNMLFNSETEVQKFDRAVSGLNVQGRDVEAILVQLKDRQQGLRNQYRKVLMTGNQVVEALTNSVKKYLREFDIKEQYGRNIFTSDLKSYSGAILHLYVVAFKLSYIKQIRECTGCKLPIILDSPRGKEVEKAAVDCMLKVILRDFPDHQIIIATIYNPCLRSQQVIQMRNGILSVPKGYVGSLGAAV